MPPPSPAHQTAPGITWVLPSPPPLFIENPLNQGTGVYLRQSGARGFIGTRITNYGDDAVSLFGAQANALHRHLFRCAELTVTKLNLITKEHAIYVAALYTSGEAASQLFLLHGVDVLWCFQN
jgi:hypothetical protein